MIKEESQENSNILYGRGFQAIPHKMEKIK